MNLLDLLPTKKVTAFIFGGALCIVAFWFLIDVLTVLDAWPEAWVMGAFTIVVGAVCAWFIPESAWQRLGPHVTRDGSTTDPD